MPGTILGLKVTDGTTVKKGQSILVLEAMKMENDIAANADGVITFSVAKGASVSTGDLLAVIA
jgi:biotin carboxyl carrier protein